MNLVFNAFGRGSTKTIRRIHDYFRSSPNPWDELRLATRLDQRGKERTRPNLRIQFQRNDLG